MALYTNQTGKLKEVKEKPFKLEKDIQKVFEENLLVIMGLALVKSEFIIKNKRIDTLAYDPQTCAFIIIEYKRDKNISVVDQGFTYLSLMLENKADFIVEYNESLRQNMKREDVDWSQTRVAFVSPSFTENQIQATNFKDIAIELWEVKQYEDEVIVINRIKKSNSSESIKPLTKNKESYKSVTDEIIVFTEEDHISKGSDYINELYEKFKSAILMLSEGIEVIPKKQYMAFNKGKNICGITILKNSINIFINLKIGQLEDSKGMAKDVSNVGHWAVGDYQIKVEDDRNLEYIMSLVKQGIQIDI
jgi:predicted transport protein